ncbi:MAG: LUD domain-containing protein, partial [Desulfuromonadales bacterium]|nr:LUD domain-containing protein [Desulfuromonadales bacterium]
MKINTDRFIETARRELKNERSRSFLRFLPRAFLGMREAGMATFRDPGVAQAYAAAIRAEAVARLPGLLEEFERNATARGARVLWAKDAREACDLVIELAREREISYTAKGKSMVTEELGLNEALKDAGIEAFETDLGEFIAQQLDRPPFHIVGPAINVPVEEIRDLFMAKAGLTEPTLDPVKLGYAVRVFLREKFRHLELGITGVNMAVAETGSIINVENEGNIRLAKSSPRAQISIMSIEKVIPTMADAAFLLRILCRNCTGQRLSSYVTIDNGPKKRDEIDGPEELIVIIVDNDRSDFYGDLKFREALRCIRCGACLNTCPVYTKIGGYPYGFAYSGPIGQVLNPLLLGFDRTRDLYHACTLCGACKAICPGGVDHPGLFLYYRA